MTIIKAELVRVNFIALIFLVSGYNLHAQWTDYGLWSGAGISQDVFENFSYEVETQARWDYDFSRLGSAFVDFGISKDLASFAPGIKVATSLRLGVSRADNFLWEPIRRLSGSARWKTDLSENLAFSCRLRYQSSLKEEGSARAMRLRGALHYKVSKKLKATFYTEVFTRRRDFEFYYSDFRARFILSVKTSKRRWASFGYQVEQQKNTPDPWAEHRLICTYDIELKGRKAEK
tara:strand:+ start:59 stop:757 length:699 start_codon:yes stop_codon:yes gene_type:complete